MEAVEFENATPYRLMSAEQLLEELFEPNSRPSLRWLRNMQKAKVIPSIKIGHLVFFEISEVREALKRKNTGKAK